MRGFSFFSAKRRRLSKSTPAEEALAAKGPAAGASRHPSAADDPEAPALAEAGIRGADHTGAAESDPQGDPSVCQRLLHAEENWPPRGRGLLPGSDGEHQLQSRYGSEDRARAFYTHQVLNYLSPAMQEFIARQEILIVATADRHGECDCTSKFGRPGFIRVLGEKYLAYPEYRGNGVFANLGNITENPHIGMLMLDLYQDAIGLHVNGKARIVENEELLSCRDNLADDVIEEIGLEGKKRPERWIMVEVEEAYIQCSKHIPLMKKLDKRIEWGTDNAVAKGGDYFHLREIPLYDRVGGDKAMETVVDVFYRNVLQDELVGPFFKDVDPEAQRLKQKSFLAMAFGGPYHYTSKDMREVHQRLVREHGLSDAHFDRVMLHFRRSVSELHVPGPEVEQMCAVLETFRDDVLGR